jgi:hypothetical protein
MLLKTLNYGSKGINHIIATAASGRRSRDRQERQGETEYGERQRAKR